MDAVFMDMCTHVSFSSTQNIQYKLVAVYS
jgi:hypothetical protein